MTIQGMDKDTYIKWRMEAYQCSEREALAIWSHFEEQEKNKNMCEVEKYQNLLDAMYN